MHVASSCWLGSFRVDLYDLCFTHYITPFKHTHTHTSPCYLVLQRLSPPGNQVHLFIYLFIFFFTQISFQTGNLSSKNNISCSDCLSSYFAQETGTHIYPSVCMSSMNFTPKHCRGVDRVSKWTLASDDVGWGDKGAKCEAFQKLSLQG